MAGVHEIRLAASATPRFADRCVVCGGSKPASQARILSRDGTCHIKCWAGWHAFRAPCCCGCLVRLHAWRLWDLIRTFAIAGGALAIGLLWLEPRLPGILAGLTTLAMFIVGLAMTFAWNRRFPPAFNVYNRAASGYIEYEFRDREAFEEFCRLNHQFVVSDSLADF